MDPTIVVALVGGIFSTAAAGLGILSTALLRRSERARRVAELEAIARAAEAERLRAERDRLDVRTEHLLDEYQDEIARLRAILANREQGCTG